MDLERLDEWELDNIQAIADRAEEMGVPYADWFYKLLGMARAYRDLLADGERAEPDEADIEVATAAIAGRYGNELRGDFDIWRVDPRALARTALQSVAAVSNISIPPTEED